MRRALLPAALRTARKGGTVVCAGIHMSDIPTVPYDILWGERSIRSVANLTRADGEEFLALAPRAGVRCEVETFPPRAGKRGASSAAGWPDFGCPGSAALTISPAPRQCGLARGGLQYQPFSA